MQTSFFEIGGAICVVGPYSTPNFSEFGTHLLMRPRQTHSIPPAQTRFLKKIYLEKPVKLCYYVVTLNYYIPNYCNHYGKSQILIFLFCNLLRLVPCTYRLDGQKCHKKTADHELNFDRIYTTLRQLFTFQRSYFKTPLQTMS